MGEWQIQRLFPFDYFKGEMHMEASRGIGVFLLAGVLGVLSSGTTHAQDPMNDANTASAHLPKDVYPDSRDRLPLPKRSDTDEYGNKCFRRITRNDAVACDGAFHPSL